MSVRSLNKVLLIGNMTRDPELRYTPSGTAVCNFGLATNRQWTATDGTTQEATEFHRIVAWAKLAEICSQLLFKGRKVYVEGRLQTREWVGADGTKQRTTEVVADTMIVLDSRKREGEMGGEEPIKRGPAEMAAPAAAAEASVPGEGQTAAVPSAPTDDQASAADDQTAVKSRKKQTKAEEKATDGNQEVKPEDLPF